jgi:predicted nucleotidyltransferase/predicted transcriptional regulator
MYKRLNITLPDGVVSRADEFAKRERYTRSALIAAALEAFVSADAPARSDVAGEAPAVYAAGAAAAVYASEAVGLNPSVRPLVPAIIEACRKRGVTYAALVGSSTQPDPAIVPRDLDILVRFEPVLEGYARRFFGLLHDLEDIAGRSVDVIEADAVRNRYLREEFERTRVVLYEAT